MKSLCTRSGISHAKDSGSGVLELEILVGELGSVDGLAPGAVVVGEVATLKKIEESQHI